MQDKKRYVDLEYLFEWRLRKALRLWNIKPDRYLFDAADRILEKYRKIILRLKKSDLN